MAALIELKGHKDYHWLVSALKTTLILTPGG